MNETQNKNTVKKLNVGSGKDIKKGWHNLDMHNHEGVDKVFDLNEIFDGKKIPYPDNYFDYIYCCHVLEDFLEPVPVMDEFARICKKGGLIEIKTPFETHNWNTNIYHKRSFTLGQFVYYIDRENYDGSRPLKIYKARYYCRRSKNFFKRNFQQFVEMFYNSFSFKTVESSFLKFLFPIINIQVIYEKL